jgi:phosphoribosylformylglycinamidine cyclo-ligase
MTYRKAGVNIDEADLFIAKIKPMVRSTARPEVMGTIGGFSGLFAPRLKGMRKPVLVSSTDGVGTKLLVAEALKKYDTVGIDLVAMSVDDVVVLGAEPLFFLDYIAVGRLDAGALALVMKGIVKGCREANCALLGGETAELPGLYAPGKWDLAGFCVGLVDADRIIDGRTVRPGDKVIGLASSGLHSNGYSLARKVFTEEEILGKIGRDLLKPTRIYTRPVLEILKLVRIKSMAHITGGGFTENIPRVIPEDRCVEIRRGSWTIPPIFHLIREKGGIGDDEMFRTFNMGVGMVLVVAPGDAERTVALFAKLGLKAWVIGDIRRGSGLVVLPSSRGRKPATAIST